RCELDWPFDLERGPLLRAGVLDAGGEPVLWLAAHHLVADFWSLALLLRDLGAAYAAGGREVPGPAPGGVTYAEWARGQRERTAGPEGRAELAWWREALAGELPRLELPADRPRPAVRTWDGGAVDFRLGPEA